MPVLGHLAKLGIHRGQTDPLALLAEVSVELLRRAEPRSIAERSFEGPALTGHADGCV